jgi:hypothetical protein
MVSSELFRARVEKELKTVIKLLDSGTVSNEWFFFFDLSKSTIN